ncbi:acyltransferase family protein [Serratia odorifera]|uniref:acyltransferase family protein n=1 Tax=Serratia odorifera TaxID=618 RepID=UPI003D2B5637
MDNKIIFADQLRGLAILSVITAHWGGVFWDNRWMVASLTQSPYFDYPAPAFVESIKTAIPLFDFGQFGVAIFFLISGFVIPFSLGKKTTKGFIKSRFMRIFPTYLAASVLSITIVSITSLYYWGIGAHYNWAKVFYNLTLTNSLFDILSFDAVNWTLSVEIKFYLLCALMTSALTNGRKTILIAVPLTVLLFTFIFETSQSVYKIGGIRISLFNIKMELMFIGFMFAGVAFNFHFKRLMSTTNLVFISLLICFITLITWYIGPIKNQYPSSPASFIYATVLFSICYILKNHFREKRALTFLSGISYPLYITHSVIGYTILRITLDSGQNIYSSMAITALLIFIIATTIHHTIERYSINKGKLYK